MWNQSSNKKACGEISPTRSRICTFFPTLAVAHCGVHVAGEPPAPHDLVKLGPCIRHRVNRFSTSRNSHTSRPRVCRLQSPPSELQALTFAPRRTYLYIRGELFAPASTSYHQRCERHRWLGLNTWCVSWNTRATPQSDVSPDVPAICTTLSVTYLL